ncbi:MAG: DNA polymerase III subunit gamma/tau [Siphonobacter aquaeclarae]|nr:DNA polymerase III subunit gamma/tau [Siphonobacter aquaeclarae]
MEDKQFVVSARKYRPVTFDSVVGQSHITTTLKNAIRTNHLAQAFLFCGPRGVGKTTCARILAKTINCLRLDDHVEPCGECENCVAFQNNASLNVHELDAASNNSVEDIRNLIDQVRYPPQMGSKKVYIIDEVHMLSTSAFNAFLKTLEEPPSYAIFILATTEKHKILPTILSRCQIFDFNRIQIKDMADHLGRIANNEGIRAEYEALELIAQKADGGLRDALSMFDLNVTFSKDNALHYRDVLENLHILDYDYYFRMTDALLDGSVPATWLLFDEILRKGFDGHQFVVGLLEHFRNLMVCKDPATVQLLQVSASVQNRYLEQSARASLSFLLSALSLGSQCDINYKQAKQQRLHVEIALSKMAHLPAVLNLASLPSAPAADGEKKKPVESVSTPAEPKEAAPVAVPQPEVPAAPATPPAPPVPRKPAVSSRLKATIDLNDFAETSEKETEVAEAVVRQNQEYTEEELHKAWHAFVEQRRLGGSMSEVVMLDRAFSVEKHVIQLGVDNPVQLELLNDLKTDLLTFLRTTLKNGQLQIHAFVLEQQVNRLPYTQSEKFSYMLEKNPAIQDLKNSLGLDFDW